MNSTNTEDVKANKNCLLVFRNKKLNNFDDNLSVISEFSKAGYYFDKISYIAYDNANDIVRAVWDGKDNYENLVIICPSDMEYTLKHFLSKIFASEFDELGILKTGIFHTFILFSDKENKLKVEDISKILNKKYGIGYEKAFIKTVGAPSKLIGDAIAEALDGQDAEEVRKLINFNVSEKFGDCTIEIVYSDKMPKSLFDSVFRSLLKNLEEYVYSVDDFTLAERLFQILQLRRMKIGVAESFTGGGISKRLVEIAGISEVYTEGLNVYSNEAKKMRLGVKEETLRMYGAVSEQTAYEMAQGLINGGLCDVSIATTGIAGPKSDLSSKPVGLVYLSVGTKDDVAVYKYNLKGDRKSITETAINLALFHTFKILK